MRIHAPDTTNTRTRSTRHAKTGAAHITTSLQGRPAASSDPTARARQKSAKSAESFAEHGLASVTMLSAGSHSYLLGSNLGGLKAAPRCA